MSTRQRYFYKSLLLFVALVGNSGVLEEDFAVLEKSTCSVLSKLYDNAYSAEMIDPSLEDILASKVDSPSKMNFTFRLKTNLKNGSDDRSGDLVKFFINKSWYRRDEGIAFSGEKLIFFNGTFGKPESFCFINENELLNRCNEVEKSQLNEGTSKYSNNKSTLLKRVDKRELYRLKRKNIFDVSSLYDIRNNSVYQFLIGDEARAFVKNQYDFLSKYNFEFEKDKLWSTPSYRLLWLHSLSLKELTELFYDDYKLNQFNFKQRMSYQGCYSYLKEQFDIAEKYNFIQQNNEKYLVDNQGEIIKTLPLKDLVKLFLWDYNLYPLNLKKHLSIENYGLVDAKFRKAIEEGYDLNELWRKLHSTRGLESVKTLPDKE